MRVAGVGARLVLSWLQARHPYPSGHSHKEMPVSGLACTPDQQIDTETGISSRRSTEIMQIITDHPYWPSFTQPAPYHGCNHIQQIKIRKISPVRKQVGAKISFRSAYDTSQGIVVIAHCHSVCKGTGGVSTTICSPTIQRPDLATASSTIK